ncbi:MAG: hypothetical protein ACPGRZ_03355 [Alphaproteobacteria bacterium]
MSIVVVVLLSGCVADRSTRVPLHINAAAMSEMDATTSIVEKRRLASLNCRKAGYRKRTQPYYGCMRALIARDLQRLRDRADRYVQEAAERHGICMERATFRVARCQEI